MIRASITEPIRKATEVITAVSQYPHLVTAFFTWPSFSITSFLMLSRLGDLGLKPRTIIDVGANIGQFAVACVKRFPEATVYSFEPLPHCFATLKSVAAKLPSIEVQQLAIGDTIGEVRFHVNKHSHSSSALPLANAHKAAFPGAAKIGTITVQAVTLDSICSGMTLRPPVLLKLDVQGYEEKVLLGATESLKHISFVVAELSFEPLYVGEKAAREILGLMDRLGFVFKEPLSFLQDPKSGRYVQMDALFLRKDPATVDAI